ncbi:MAG TPA: family 20 glycosylhydrolase [Gemmatimonadaceae bacterium]|nr:family 20 glycosylhydrolase [Gemmatimonadaceae bacterium]
MIGRVSRAALLVATLAAVAACRTHPPPPPAPAVVKPPPPPAPPVLVHAVVPIPALVQLDTTDQLVLGATSRVWVDADASPATMDVARYLARLVALPTGVEPHRVGPGDLPPALSIGLRLDPWRAPELGGEGYEVTITHDGATLVAAQPAGLFYGVQTVRQLLPYTVEHRAAVGRTLAMRTGRVVDVPRFAWRGAMLDVSRHFLGADDVKRYVDAMALYKLNRLHLHLADDQGWRIEIRSWPELTRVGGSTQVGGGPGGFYTQAQFADLVAYAAARYVTIVPEIDMPGHTNAALASYPVLNCDHVAPPLYTGTAVGFSALCVERDSVYTFVRDVVREIGALTPSPWFHVGGDEVHRLGPGPYRQFVDSVQSIVTAAGKVMVGWGDIAPAALDPSTIVQHWVVDSARLHTARGGKVILSPARQTYLDMKYDSTTALGLRWAGLIDVRHAYEWNPLESDGGLPESSILGVEAPLWAETLVKREDYEFLAFPRLPALAEVGWSAASRRDWSEFRRRIAAHGPRLSALGVNFYRSPEIPWPQ